MNPEPTALDHIIRWAGLLASVAAILGAPILIYQLYLARDAFVGDQTEREGRRQNQRVTILGALRAQVRMIQESVTTDLNRFSLNHITPDVQPFVRLRENMGPLPYAFTFVWTPIPANTVEQAIYEAHLLGLSDAEVESLQELQLMVLKANTVVNTKFEALSALVAVHGGPMTVASDFMNRAVEDQFNKIDALCTRIAEWIPPA
jgi:hypothetical protein